MTPHQILVEARSKIANPENWIRKDYARVSPRGNPIGPEEDNARCFCIVGALRAAAKSVGDLAEASDLLRAQIPASRPSNILPTFNDDPETKHEDVLALFNRAIEASKEVQS